MAPRPKEYAGVCLQGGRFLAFIKFAGQHYQLGRWPTARDAALARDRAVLHYGLDRALNLAVQSRRLGPASVEDLRRSAIRLRKRQSGSSNMYRGVTTSRRGRWSVAVRVGVGYRVDGYPSAEDAAVAHDRLVLWLLGPESRSRLNFPDRELTPAPARALRQEILVLQATDPRYKTSYRSHHTLRSTVLAKRRAGATCFRGVVLQPGSNRWRAALRTGLARVGIGGYETPEEAAVARDRMALYYDGPETFLNFPGRTLTPASAKALRRELRALRAARRVASVGPRAGQHASSSPQLGTAKPRGAFGVVHKRTDSTRPWSAHFVPPNCKTLALGTWKTEREAALAHDRAALFYLGDEYEWFNDLPRARRAGAADAATIRAEAAAQFKTTTSSRFRGVHHDPKQNRWIASMSWENRRRDLGSFASEEDAALAYDRAALKRWGREARVNFHPETGEELCGLKRLRHVGTPEAPVDRPPRRR